MKVERRVARIVLLPSLELLSELYYQESSLGNGGRLRKREYHGPSISPFYFTSLYLARTISKEVRLYNANSMTFNV